MTTKKTYRIDDDLAADISSLASDNNMTENVTVETALKFHLDYSEKTPSLDNQHFIDHGWIKV